MQQVSIKDAKKAISRYDAIKNKFAKFREKKDQATKRVVGTLEVTAAAFGTGVLQGRTGGVELAGVPVELLAGGVCFAVSALGDNDEHADHIANLGNGILGGYAAAMGRGVGMAWKDKAIAAATAQGQIPTTKTSGHLGPAMSQADILRTAQAMPVVMSPG